MILQASPYLSDPAGQSPLLAAIAWIEGTVLGSLATAVAVICVAVVGLMMFSGRLDMRRGLVVVLGCFVLFGASTIVEGVRGTGERPPVDVASTLPPAPPMPSRSPAPERNDPYAGASIIRR